MVNITIILLPNYRGLPGIVLGSVIGGLILIAIIVTVCICYQKKKRSVGRVVHPVGYNTGPTVVSKYFFFSYGMKCPSYLSRITKTCLYHIDPLHPIFIL